MSNKSNKTNSTSKTTNKNGKANTAVKKKDRTWIIYVAIGVVALVGIVLLAVFGGGSANKVNGQSNPSRQQQTLPDCCQ